MGSYTRDLTRHREGNGRRGCSWPERRRREKISAAARRRPLPTPIAWRSDLISPSPKKAALKDLSDASASADASAKTSLCADKTDLSMTPGRMAFAEKMAETRRPESSRA